MKPIECTFIYENLVAKELHACLEECGYFFVSGTRVQLFFVRHVLDRLERQQDQWKDEAVGLMLIKLVVGLPLSLVALMVFPKSREISKVLSMESRSFRYRVCGDLIKIHIDM